MMHRILDPVSEGGMGYRRCQWTTTTLNVKSQAASKRLGYTHEGVLRGFKILPPGKEACRGMSLFASLEILPRPTRSVFPALRWRRNGTSMNRVD
jgi:RimJ/RimL family protein N-acetyltransferase